MYTCNIFYSIVISVIGLCVQSYSWRNLPGLLFGLLSLVAAVLSLCLPETKDVPLPQSIDEGEKLAGNLVIGRIFRLVQAQRFKLLAC